jgi:hypothetical protein
MPYGTLHDVYYKEIYRLAIEAAGLTPRRADDFYTHKTLLESMWIHVQRAELVLADLSGSSANVFYELGLAHAIAKPTVVLTPDPSTVPIDLKGLPMITYDVRYPGWDTNLKLRITEEIKNVLANPPKYVLFGPTPALSADEQLVSIENASPRNLTGIIREYILKDRSKEDVIDLLSRAGLDKKYQVFVGIEYDRQRRGTASKRAPGEPLDPGHGTPGEVIDP